MSKVELVYTMDYEEYEKRCEEIRQQNDEL